MEIPDPLAYLMIAVTIISGIITILTFIHKCWPSIKIVPWKRVGKSISAVFWVFGGFYLVFFGFIAGYLISEYSNPQSTLGQLSPETFYLIETVTIYLVFGLMFFMGGIAMMIGGLKFMKATGVSPDMAETIALKLNKAHILKKNIF